MLLLALGVLASVPGRIALGWDAARHTSTASLPLREQPEACRSDGAAQLRVAPAPGRWELGDVTRQSPVSGQRASVDPTACSGFVPEHWVRDVRQSVRRVCRPFAPPEIPLELSA